MINRKYRHIPLNIEQYYKIKVLAVRRGKNANDLIEEGMVLNKYEELNEQSAQIDSNE